MWTTTVEGLLKLYLVIATIATLIITIILCISMGIIAIFIGLDIFLVVFGICAVLGVLVEISKNIENIAQNTYTHLIVASNSTNQQKTHVKNSYLSSAAASISESKPGWHCPQCGKSNPNSSRVCKDCGFNK